MTKQTEILIEQAIQEWSVQGRSPEAVWGVKNFFSGRGIELIEAMEQNQKEEIKKTLLENGHGGGNWRRIIEQI